MSFHDIFVFVLNNVYYCFDIMKDTIIFEAGDITNFPITLYDIFLGLFICSIIEFLFFGFHQDDDYEYTYNFGIFEDNYDEGYDDII